jgi:Cu+-exporting ATPase
LIFAGMAQVIQQTKLFCYHCGDECRTEEIESGGKLFCCEGCKLVHDLLEENNLCTYYDLSEHPGNKLAEAPNLKRFSWLDDEEIVKQLITFTEGETALISFSIPKIHCASCIWLLEHLHKIDEGILNVRVNFLEKKINVTFNRKKISLRRVVETLHRIGYEPDLHLSDLKREATRTVDRVLILKIGIAGFCFGNIMMLSFPEYLSGVTEIEPQLKHFFAYLSMLLALPVFFYSASDYFVNSWKAARLRYFSIDLPIALGLTAMLLRSSYEIFSGTGPGYFDSMAGLVFFLLIGRFFQSLTYRSLSFERDFKSYFPVAVTVRKNGEEHYVPISNLHEGDKIVIHSEELLPADSILLNGTASIDYSFVTGESVPVPKQIGELIYAGGKQKGSVIELQVKKTVEQSYLTQLWNHESFRKPEQHHISLLADSISKYFTITIIIIAALTAAYWMQTDVSRALLACTAILIIACPCALAITVPFTFGNIMRILGRNNFFLKNASTVEAIARIDTMVFDKTGTITSQRVDRIQWEGSPLTEYQKHLVHSLASQSIHPKSKMVTGFLGYDRPLKVTDFREHAGLGIEGTIDGKNVMLGSKDFVKHHQIQPAGDQSRLYVSVNGHFLGWFRFNEVIREGLKEQIQSLARTFKLHLLSGDNGADEAAMLSIFPRGSRLLFSQSPAQKLEYIQQRQREGSKVMMVGDGLNDSGALRQSDVGVAVTDDLHQFSPACDVIMKGSEFCRFDKFIGYCRSAMKIVWFTFGISLIYNVAGIYFAVRGELSPMIAAILMPISSISVIVITTLASRLQARRRGF